MKKRLRFTAQALLLFVGVCAGVEFSAQQCAAQTCGGIDPSCISWYPGPPGLLNPSSDFFGRNNPIASFVGNVYGLRGFAYNFDINGTTCLALGNNASLALTEEFTIEGWIYVNSYPSASAVWGMILFRGDDRGGLDPYFLAVSSNGSVVFHIESTSAGAGISAPVKTGVWQHIAATFDADIAPQMKLYRDGDLVATAVTGIKPFATLDPFQHPGVGIGNIGGALSGSASSYKFPGIIDELAIYSQALSHAQIMEIYNAGSQGKCDKTPPTITFASVSPLLVPPTGRITVEASITDNFPDGLAVTANSSPMTPVASKHQAILSAPYEPGVYIIQIVARDGAGNTTVDKSLSYRVLPVAGCTIGDLFETPIAARSKYLFRTWGKLISENGVTHTLADGSGHNVEVNSNNGGLQTGKTYAVTGAIRQTQGVMFLDPGGIEEIFLP